MARSFMALKKYKPLGAEKGHILIQNEDSAKELGMDKLVEDGYFKELESGE